MFYGYLQQAAEHAKREAKEQAWAAELAEADAAAQAEQWEADQPDPGEPQHERY